MRSEKPRLLDREAGGPARRMQRHAHVVDGQSQPLGVHGRQPRRVRITLDLRRDAVAVGIGGVQLAQRRQLAEDDGVADGDLRRRRARPANAG